MSSLHEQAPRHWHAYSEVDASFMGRLTICGLAFPNAEHLSQPALEVRDASAPAVQREIDRMLAAADGIARISHTSMAGLAHSQLATTAESPNPLQIILVPARLPGLKPEITIGNLAFQCLINTKLKVPSVADAPRAYQLSWEGCYSAGPVCAARPRSSLLTGLEARNRQGELVRATEIKGFEALVLGHEVDHGRGRRPADSSPRTEVSRHWVPRQELSNYRALRPMEMARWQKHCAPDQWQALSRDPDYVFFPTQSVQDAFWAGRLAQQRLADH